MGFPAEILRSNINIRNISMFKGMQGIAASIDSSIADNIKNYFWIDLVEGLNEIFCN